MLSIMKKLVKFFTIVFLLLGGRSYSQKPELWGMTSGGGTHGFGVIFKTDGNGNNYTTVFHFNSITGQSPSGSLIQASNGKLYGMTEHGGTNNYGVLFEFDPITNTYAKKIDFDGANSGSKPTGSLIEVSNNKLYGLTFEGGANNKGVIFEYDLVSESFTKKFDFDDVNGQYPVGALLKAGNNKLYGMTNLGGTSSHGVIFEYDVNTDSIEIKHNFDFTNGGDPIGSLIEASNGKLYGMTNHGGANQFGVIFEFEPITGKYVKLFDFDGMNHGRFPFGKLTQVSDEKLYGVTNSGGAYDVGVLFEYDIINHIGTKKLDFDNTNNGAHSHASLLKASNGKLYGMTHEGGENTYGVIFEYDTITNTLTKKLDFNGTNGKWPYYTTLIETNICYPSYNTLDVTVCDSYTVPSGNNTYTASGTYTDTIPNSCGADSIITINLTVNHSQTGDTTASACDNFTWFDNTYATSGDYTHTLQTINGCDSTVTLHLTINTVDVSIAQNGDTLFANQEGADYQWMDCTNNIPLAGSTGHLFVPAVSGSYAVEVSYNGCVDTSACYTVTITELDVNPIFNTIKIYPNPGNGNITVELSSFTDVSVTVFDASGNIIYNQPSVQTRLHSFYMNAAPGTYLMQLQWNKQVQQYKLVITQ
jgi:uncharacterized repeat protein (TIGR03803 family)